MSNKYGAMKKIMPLIILAVTTTGALAQPHEDNSRKLTIVEVVNENRREINDLRDNINQISKILSGVMDTQSTTMNSTDKFISGLFMQSTERVNHLELRIDALERELKEKK